ncbi:MAG TPA: adenylosuccinate synthetase [Candidatus Sulfotelmatobacter sp.]|nr:adenylosuccinate synthetase [Candidatus Sulfotelmatobacter sp.]
MPVNAIIGLQRGDEGKGRFTEFLAQEAEVVARFNGGPNAGHTIVTPEGTELALHTIPSGVTHEDTVNVIGNGVVIDPISLVEEMRCVQDAGIRIDQRNLCISHAAHLILPHHRAQDRMRENGEGAQGSTKKGIAYAVAAKALRANPRVEDIKYDPGDLRRYVFERLAEIRADREENDPDYVEGRETFEVAEFMASAKRIARFACDTSSFLLTYLNESPDGIVLAEGAQGSLLDIETGMYPCVTSMPTNSWAIAPGLGIPPHSVDKILGVIKIPQSHVGDGPFITEIEDEELLTRLHGDKTSVDAEVGTTTQRTRRLGFLDLPQIRRAIQLNAPAGKLDLAISKLDWVPRFGDDLAVCDRYLVKDRPTDVAPCSEIELSQARPSYAELENWDPSIDISGVRDFSDLPPAAIELVRFIYQSLDVYVSMVGVGPSRDQIIHLDR